MSDLRFPMYVSLADRPVLVIGGGIVALRRIRTLLLFDARITVIAPEYDEGLEILAREKKITLVQDIYREEYIEGRPFIVLAATNDDRVNRQICEDCRERHIPVNHAGSRQECDFFFPAVVVEENLVIGIAGDGRDHKKVSRFAAALRSMYGKIRS